MGKYEGAYSTLQVGIWRIEVVHVLVRTDPGTHGADSFISMVYIYIYIVQVIVYMPHIKPEQGTSDGAKGSQHYTPPPLALEQTEHINEKGKQVP